MNNSIKVCINHRCCVSVCIEAGGNEVDPKHKPLARREGIVGEMLVSHMMTL